MHRCIEVYLCTLTPLFAPNKTLFCNDFWELSQTFDQKTVESTCFWPALPNSTQNTGIGWKKFINALWNLRNMIILKKFCTFFLLFQNFTLFKVYPWCIFWCWKCTKFPTNLKKYTTPRCTPYEDYTLVLYLCLRLFLTLCEHVKSYLTSSMQNERA